MNRNRNRRSVDRADLEPSLSTNFYKRNKPDHKTAQLCRQVERTLCLCLADCGDETLQSLTITQISPAPDASRLLVLVCPGIAPAGMSRIDILQRLMSATGHLRHEVARSINRKRAPELLFQLVGGMGATR